MTSQTLIDESIPVAKDSDTIEEVLQKMSDNKLEALPFVLEGKLVSVLKENLLLEQYDDQALITSLPQEADGAFVKASSHWYEAVSVFKKKKLPIIPVLDDQQRYLGSIKAEKLIEKFAHMTAFNSMGATLVLQVDERTYSLSDISRIIETNGAKVLSASLFNDEEMDSFVYLIVKLSSDDASRVVAGLERFNYKVLARYQDAYFENADQQRLNQFLRYINI